MSLCDVVLLLVCNCSVGSVKWHERLLVFTTIYLQLQTSDIIITTRVSTINMHVTCTLAEI